MSEGKRVDREPSFEGPDLNDIVEKAIRDFGIGHMKDAILPVESISRKFLETYQECRHSLESVIQDLTNLINLIEATPEDRAVFNDMLNGISCALYRTLNQVLYHSQSDMNESKNAFNELQMVLEVVHNSLNQPILINKKSYPKAGASAYYFLPPEEEMGSRQVTSVDALFSKEHIAWNVESESMHDKKAKVKSGVRLDYNPLYKEKNGVIDKTETEWVTSVDVSGFHIDKIMNKYSERGHHFPGVFRYKIGLLMPGFSKALEQYFDKNAIRPKAV